MLAKIINEQTQEVIVALGTDAAYYQALGFCEMDVEESWDGRWFAAGFVPAQPEPSGEQRVLELESASGLFRPVRTALLALCQQGVALDEELMARVEEIETAAAVLRGTQPQGEEV